MRKWNEEGKEEEVEEEEEEEEGKRSLKGRKEDGRQRLARGLTPRPFITHDKIPVMYFYVEYKYFFTCGAGAHRGERRQQWP